MPPKKNTAKSQQPDITGQPSNESNLPETGRTSRRTRRTDAVPSVPPGATSSDDPAPTIPASRPAPRPTRRTASSTATSSNDPAPAIPAPAPAPRPRRTASSTATNSDASAATIPAPPHAQHPAPSIATGSNVPAPHPPRHTVPPAATSSEIPATTIPPRPARHTETSSAQPPPIILNDPLIRPTTRIPAQSGDFGAATFIPYMPQPVAGPSRLPDPAPLPSTPQHPQRQYQFMVQTPGDQGTARHRPPPESVEPSRDLRKNKQRANTILYTPRSRRHMDARPSTNQAVLDTPLSQSPTPAGARQSESLAGDSGSDGPEEHIPRLNLGQGAAAARARRFLPAALAPLHGRPGRTPAAKPSNRKRKDVWKWLKKDPENVERRFCIFCQKEHAANPKHDIVSYGTNTSVSTVEKHLIEKHLGDWVTACEDAEIPIRGSKGQAAARKYHRLPPATDLENERPKFSHETFVEALTEYVVGDDQAINCVESPRLRKVFLLLRESLREKDIPGRTAIRNHIDKMQKSHLETLSRELKDSVGKISFTTDNWTDPNQTSFMAVTAHWIHKTTAADGTEQLKLRSDLVGFHKIPGRHNGNHLAHCFLYVLDRIGVTHKIGWITCDNASNNNTLMETLERLLRGRGIKFDKIRNRIRCFPHIVNLACQAVLGMLTSVEFIDESAEDYEEYNVEGNIYNKDLIASIRSLINTIRNSSLKKDQFAELAKRCNEGKELQLIRDVVTRWSSTVLMIKRIIKLRDAVDEITTPGHGADLDKFALTDEDWDLLKDFAEILEVPHAFQDILGTDTNPSLCFVVEAFDLFIESWNILIEKCPHWKPLIEPGLSKLADYRYDIDLVPAYYLALALDPRVKLTELDLNTAEGRRKHKKARDLLIKAIREEQAEHPTVAPVQLAAPRSREKSARDILGMNRRRQAQGPALSIEAEVDLYLADPCIEHYTLQYWTDNKLKFPRVISVAMNIAPIQASSVPCERVFSSGKETMAPRRRRIKPALMEKLQMLKFSIRKGTLNFTEGLSWAEELIEIEELQKTFVPADMWSYQTVLSVEEDDGDEEWEDLVEVDEEEENFEDLFADDGEDGEDDDDDDGDDNDDGPDYDAIDADYD